MASAPERTPRKRERKCCSRPDLPPVRVIVTLVACFVIQLAMGIDYTAGNTLPYMGSYLRNVTGETSLDYGTAVWIPNSIWLATYIILPLIGLLERRMSHRLLLIVGIIANAFSFFGTYWALQTSFVLTVIIRGVVHSVGQAILWPLTISLALRWFPHRKGFVGACIIMGYGGGAFIWNQIITAWINPRNLPPDFKVNGDLYFTQQEVLNNVPSCHLLLGGTLTAMLTICVACLAYPPHDSKEKVQEMTIATPETQGRDCSIDAGKPLVINSLAVGVANERCSDDMKDGECQNDMPVYTPLQVLKSRAALTTWLINFGNGFAVTVIWAFYKTYGQTFIHDDHQLALIGSLSAVFNCLGRPLWGLLADRIGIQTSLMVCQSLFVVLSATLVTCEFVGASMFFAWICLTFFAFSGW